MKTTSNIDLAKFLSKHKLQFNDICYKNDLPPILKKGWYIINMEDHTKKSNGTHWVCFYKGDINAYFDSFGAVPPQIIDEKLKKYIYNGKEIQDIDSNSCGWFCLTAIYYFENKPVDPIKFNNFLELWKDDPKKNETLIKELFETVIGV